MSSLLDALGWVGESLDKPGAAVRGLLAGKPDQLANLVPFSDTMGLTDPSSRVSGRGLLQHWGAQQQGDDSFLGGLAGMGTELATDPLTYLGAGLAQKGVGALRGAAMARGPRYAGGLEKLAAAGLTEGGEGASALAKLQQSPEMARLLQEVPQGSQFLGGNNALAFKTPQNDVVRLGQEASRLDIPEMLQPTRNVKIGDWRAERVPLAEQVGDRGLYQQQYRPMADSLRAQGLHPADLQPGNFGTYQGNPVLIDPGAAVPHPNAVAGGQTFARAPETMAQDPGRVGNFLLDSLGYDNWVQQQLAGGGSRGLPASLLGVAPQAGARFISR